MSSVVNIFVHGIRKRSSCSWVALQYETGTKISIKPFLSYTAPKSEHNCMLFFYAVSLVKYWKIYSIKLLNKWVISEAFQVLNPAVKKPEK